MNKLLLALTLGATLFCGSAHAQANRQALSGYCEDGGQTVTSAGVTSTTKVQRSYPGCTVTVYVSGTSTLATIYADLAGTPKANPFTANGTTGYWFFYADPARFDVQLSGAGMSTVTRGGLWIVAGSGGGGGVSGSGTTNTIPKWTASTTLGDSIITEIGGTQARVGGDLQVTGVAGISTSPSSSNSLTISKTFSSAGSYNGILTDTVLQNIINGVGSSYAGRFVLTTSGTTVNLTDLGGLRVIASHTGSGNLSENYGLYASVNQSGSGTMTDPIGIRSDLSLGLSLSNVVTNFKATGTLSAGSYQSYIDFYSKPPTLSGGSTIATHYGFLSASAPSVWSGITTFYPFYSIEGIVSFGAGQSRDRLELRAGLPIRFYDPTDAGYTQIVQNSAPAGNFTLRLPTNTPIATDVLTVTGVSGSNVTLAWSPASASGANVRKALNVVTDYGCAGDGVTDDTACINNALTAAAASTGYKVYLPAGTYKVTGITVTGQIEVEGDGDGKTIIYSTTNTPIVNAGSNGNSRGPTIRNLTVRGDVAAGGSQIGLKVDDATYVHSVRVSNVTIENTGDYGLYVGNAFSSTFENMFISNTANYPLLYNGQNMPQNRFESIYIGDLRSGVTSGFRIKAGDFFCKNCNGVNTVVANSWWATLGKKAGVDGDVSNGSAYAYWDGGNAESTVAGGIRHYYNSVSEIGPGFQFAGDASGSGSYVALLYEVDSAIFPPFFQKGLLSDRVVFANSPSSYFANSLPIHSNDVPPVMTDGQGPRVAGADDINTYYDSTLSKAIPLTRADGGFKTVTVTATANGNYSVPTVRAIKANCAAACTITIPWPGWYNRTGEYLTVYDASGAAATNNITLQAASAGTINGSATYALTRDKESVILVPDNTGTDWRVVTNYPGDKVPSIQSGGTPNLDFYPTWSSTQGILSLSSGIYNLGGQTVFTNDVLANTDNTDDIGASGGNRFRTIYAATGFSGPKYTVAGNIFWSSGAGSPEGVVTADIGSLYSRNNGASNTTIYAKTSGSGNTGWEVLLNSGGGGGITGSGTPGKLPVFTGATTVGDSLITESGTTETIAGQLVVNQADTTVVGATFKAVAASTAELLQIKDSGGSVRGGYATSGAFFFRGFSSAPTNSLANDGKLFYDITGGVTNQQLLLSKNTGTYNPVVTAEQASFTVNRLVKWSSTAGSWQATDISGATSDGTSVTFTSGNLKATSPRFTTDVSDSSGNEVFKITPTASAVNEVTLVNAATGNPYQINASGGDSNVSLNLNPKGTGGIGVNLGSTNPTAMLHVKARATSNEGLQVDSNSGAVSGIYTSDGSTLLLGGTTNHTLEVWTNGTTRLAITGAGAANFTGSLTVGSVAVPTISSTSTFTNKTLTSSTNVLGGVTMTLGSDADGDMYYRASNVLTRLAKGTAGQCLQMNGGATAPTWGSCGGASGLTVGTTTVTSGTGGRLLYETSGNVLGEVAGSSADANGALTLATSARSSGTTPYLTITAPADTGLTASTEAIGINFNGSATRQHATGALTTQREFVFQAPTYSFVGASTITTAATVAITGPPTAGANATITNPYALWVQAGNVLFGAYATVTHSLTVATGGGSLLINNGGTDMQLGDAIRLRSDGRISWAGSPNAQAVLDTGLARHSAGILRITNSSTGSGQLLIGVSSDTVSAQLDVRSQSTSRVGFRVDSLANSTVDLAQFNLNADDTSTVANLATFAANSNGTAAAGFGQSFTYTLESSTTNDQTAAIDKIYWNDATHASRGSVRSFSTVSNAATSERLLIAPRKTLTDASATSLFDATCASNTACGGTVEATIIATDGTEYQTRTVVLTYQAVNKAGTLTSSVTVVSETAAVSSGTLTGTWSASNGSGKITIQLNADTSLTSTALYVIYNVKNNSEQAIAIL